MATIDLVTALFYEVDEQMRAIPKHPEAHLWPSEVVTLGLLHALTLLEAIRKHDLAKKQIYSIVGAYSISIGVRAYGTKRP